MTTLESRYEERVQELARSRAAPGVVSDEEAAYILDTVPFIREYTSSDGAGPSRGSKGKAGIDSFVTINKKSNRSMVYQQYLVHVEKCPEATQAMPTRAMRDHEDAMTCHACDRPFSFNSRESELVCLGCGAARTHMEMSEHNITYDQESQQNSIINYFAYKRLNHFTEWLNSLQARENTEIPAEVLEAVRAEFRKERASKRGDIKPSKVRAHLKKLKLNKYYENTNAICNALNGVPAPKLPPYLEERLKRMFGDIQEPFEKHCPPTRKNFLSYSYVLYKFCELLGEGEGSPEPPRLLLGFLCLFCFGGCFLGGLGPPRQRGQVLVGCGAPRVVAPLATHKRVAPEPLQLLGVGVELVHVDQAGAAVHAHLADGRHGMVVCDIFLFCCPCSQTT